jgi:hypothetical protein
MRAGEGNQKFNHDSTGAMQLIAPKVRACQSRSGRLEEKRGRFCTYDEILKAAREAMSHKVRGGVSMVSP